MSDGGGRENNPESVKIQFVSIQGEEEDLGIGEELEFDWDDDDDDSGE